MVNYTLCCVSEEQSVTILNTMAVSTAMSSGIHLCTQVDVIITRRPLCSSTVILRESNFSERINSA